MLEQSVRQAILERQRRGQSVRAIARALQSPAPPCARFCAGAPPRCHAVGDANRSGRAERMFRFIEHGFLAGWQFADWPRGSADLP